MIGLTASRDAEVMPRELVFLVAVTLLAELCDAAGVFDVAAREAAHAARGRTLRLFLMLVAIATATTILLSLDTTAVLLTPLAMIWTWEARRVTAASVPSKMRT